MEYKNNIFQVLSKLDNNDYGYFNNLDEDNKKELQPYTLLRWLSSVANNETQDKYYTMITNSFVNNHFFELSGERDLQIKLLATCGIGNGVRHNWNPVSKSNDSKNKKIVKAFFPSMKKEDFDLYYDSLSKKDIESLMQKLGIN